MNGLFKLSLILLLLLSAGVGTATGDSAHSMPFTRTSAIDGISITADNQILVELMPEDTAPANLFDLNGRTLVFTPDGQGGYSRQVQPLAWEENIGVAVADGAVIGLESFAFDFAGQSWGSFHVSRHGVLTFGGPLTYAYWDAENRFSTMREIAAEFVDTPTISPLYKPMLGGRGDDYGATQHVKRWPNRIVVTWTTTEPDFYVHSVPPEKPAHFQAVLRADGSVRFNYSDVTFGDGIVGLFPNEEVTKGDIIASISDGVDRELPGYLDLLEATIYATNTDAVILEFVTRDAIPEPGVGERYSYRLYFDTDQPYWTRYGDGSDLDFMWRINLEADGEYWTGGKLLASDASNRIAMLMDISDVEGLSAMVIADAAQFNDQHGFVQGNNSSPMQIELPTITKVDLSQSDSRFTSRHSEVFHYPSAPDPVEIACRAIDVLGDRFDLFVFHSEFRVDSQESGNLVQPHYGNARREGIGIEWNSGVPCGEGRLKVVWELPVWMKSYWVVSHNRYYDERTRFDQGLVLFAHEFTHVWTAYLSYNRNGEREPLFGNYCRCHWRPDLHAPAAFPWYEEETGPRSLMDGRYWHDNGDGTFTPRDGRLGGGHSWLDLYAMGLADASEVPDMFILRNLKALTQGNGEDGYRGGVFTGDKEIVSIEQVIAAEGLRKPSAAESQKVFNAGFVYLLEPGKTPTGDLLDLHAEYRDKVVEHWSHITGGRSHITTNVKVPQHVTLENPTPGSFQSGLGVISGWACEAEEIIIELAGTPVPAAYGTPRADTQERCGDTNNGFGLLVNWNNLGDGEHTVRALADGVEFATTTVQVSTFGTDFLEDVRRTVVVSDFPRSGDETTLQWEESLQNFVITDGRPRQRGGYNHVAGLGARLENPSLGSSQSGIRFISGWACEAEEIVIELAGMPVTAAYGTPRADTQARCGDTNNGFGLLVNWNNLGDGEHTVRALADGVEFATTTVQVSTFGTEFLEDVRRTVVVSDFPRSGDETTLQWEESLQNFVIVP